MSARFWRQIKFARTRLSALLFPRFLNPPCVWVPRGNRDCGLSAFVLRSPRMANRFYDPGELRSAKVRDLFAAIAPRYDLINDLQSFGLHRWWKRRSIQLARVRAGEHALDLCCGTGDLAFALARQGAGVVGLDFSAPMLAVAQARYRERPLAASASSQPRPATRNPQ